jgi:hypothetical protein
MTGRPVARARRAERALEEARRSSESLKEKLAAYELSGALLSDSILRSSVESACPHCGAIVQVAIAVDLSKILAAIAPTAPGQMELPRTDLLAS